MKRIFLFLSSVAIFGCFSCKDGGVDSNPVTEKSEVLTHEEWIKKYAINVSSTSPNDDNFLDLQPLKEKIGNSNIVLLGEQSHGDGATFLAKTRLIKFLHKEMNFDVLLFESGIYDCKKVNDFLQSGDAAYDAVSQGVFGIWTLSAQFQDLIQYIGANRNSLEIGGLDLQFSGKASRYFFIKDLEELLTENNIDTNRFVVWANIKKAIQKISEYDFTPPTNAERANFNSQMNALINELRTKMSANSTVSKKIAFWIQVLENVNVEANRDWEFYPYTNDLSAAPKEIKDVRDIQMGKNLIWLAKEYYKGRKIIVWAATYHIVKNYSTVESSIETALGDYKYLIRMGHYAWQELQSQMYILGFTAYEGTYGSVATTTPATLAKPQADSFEDLIYRSTLQNAIIDFRSPQKGGEWLSEKRYCRPLGYVQQKADWSKILDGIFYTRTMIPSERAK
ncbi:MAG: erythromycin esterase family protein [Ignavibacteriales bacterium]|nr:erythromycin esterase family protein [Ignavibacteriales bacterium]